MIVVYIVAKEKTIIEKEKKLNSYQELLTETRQAIRSIKKELVQDERLPSVLEIEKRLNLQKKVEFYSRVILESNDLLQDVKVLSKDWEKLHALEKDLPNDFFSKADRKKLSFLQDYFIRLLRKFNYLSKPFEAIKISHDNYLPVAQKMIGENFFYNIKFDSSASDFIRCL